MIERIYETPLGPIHYWVGAASERKRPALAFLPGNLCIYYGDETGMTGMSEMCRHSRERSS